MKNRDRFIDAVGKVSERHVKAHIKRISPTGFRKYLVYPASVAVYGAACLIILAIIPLIIINIPKEKPGSDPVVVTVESTVPETTVPESYEEAIVTTEEPTESSTETTETVETVTEPETTPVPETTALPETTPAPVVTTPAPVPESPKSTLNISEQVMLSPISAMRTVNGIEFKVTVTENGSQINEENHLKYFDEETVQEMKKYWENHVTVHLSVENKGNETVYGCEYYRAMFPMGAAMYADGQPTSDDPSEYTTYFFVQDFDPYSGYQRADPNAENFTFNPIMPMGPGFTITPPVYGMMYNGGDATIGKKLEIRATLAVFDNPSENMKNGIFTEEDIDNLVFVDIVIPWDRDMKIEPVE